MNESDTAQVVIEAQMAALLAQYGDRLDDTQRAKLRQELVGAWQRAQKIRGVLLANDAVPFLSYTPQSNPPQSKRGSA